MATNGTPSTDRPYRSHSRPACTACRKRKSRCTLEAGSLGCLMCLAHKTDCNFPPGSETPQKPSLEKRKAVARAKTKQRTLTSPSPGPIHLASTAKDITVPTAQSSKPVTGPSPSGVLSQTCGPLSSSLPEEGHSGLPISLHQAEADDSPHILGPAVTSDSNALADYLANVRDGSRAMTMIRPMLGGHADPVMFTRVEKRPLGMPTDPTPPSLQVYMIQKMLEPWAEDLVDVFLSKANICFPLLDEESFRNQFKHARDRISPALLATVYAHSLTYWQSQPHLASQSKPDGRFAWNLCVQILFSEMRHSPGISTIPAILLNVGGRPTTSMIGNNTQLGSAVSLCHALGLNRNPLSWHVPQTEKYLRMKLWWCLLVHDRWLSLAYGTPPHLRRSQYDVPSPTEEYLLSPGHNEEQRHATSVFIALVSLSELLEQFLDHVYDVRSIEKSNTGDLELALDQWVDDLTGIVRKIIVRGSHLSVAGAPNLRLAYLSVRLLLRRLELDVDKEVAEPNARTLDTRYMQVRRTAEDIVHLVQELDGPQLHDFWLPVSAFTFSHTVTFLIRCALDTEKNTPLGLSSSPSLKMAKDLLLALRSHQENHGWDLADICLTQHSDVIDKLLEPEPSEELLANFILESQQDFMPDFPFMEDLFYTSYDFFSGG